MIWPQSARSPFAWKRWKIELSLPGSWSNSNWPMLITNSLFIHYLSCSIALKIFCVYSRLFYWLFGRLEVSKLNNLFSRTHLSVSAGIGTTLKNPTTWQVYCSMRVERIKKTKQGRFFGRGNKDSVATTAI